VYSPGVVIFKDDLDHDCQDLPKAEQLVVGVLTVAAPCGPRLKDNMTAIKDAGVLEDLREKIRLVYRMAAHNKHHYLVLGMSIFIWFSSYTQHCR
jgi:hypothetical protein